MSFYDYGDRGVYQAFQQRKQNKIIRLPEGRNGNTPMFSPAFFLRLSMYSLGKSERLCSKKLLDELLASKCSFVKYPFRIVFKESSLPGEFPARVAVSVGKKKFKRAVKRNRVKRLVREAFRLNKTEFYDRIPAGKTVDLLFIYLDNNLPTYAKTELAIKNAMQKIVTALAPDL